MKSSPLPPRRYPAHPGQFFRLPQRGRRLVFWGTRGPQVGDKTYMGLSPEDLKSVGKMAEHLT